MSMNQFASSSVVKQTRLVDKDNRKYIRIKTALVLSLPQTGSQSVIAALKILGCAVYDSKEAIAQSATDSHLWIEAGEQKVASDGVPYGQKDFDKITGRYDVVASDPAVYFSSDFIDSYYNTKVIITKAPSSEEWLSSMKATVFSIPYSLVFKAANHLQPDFLGNYSVFFNTVVKSFYGGCGDKQAKQAYDYHYTSVINAIEKNNLLEFDPGQGWKPLCDFLGKPIPDEPFPKIDEAEVFYDTFMKPAYDTVKPVIVSYAISAFYVFMIAFQLFSAIFLALGSSRSPDTLMSIGIFYAVLFTAGAFMEDSSTLNMRLKKWFTDIIPLALTGFFFFTLVASRFGIAPAIGFVLIVSTGPGFALAVKLYFAAKINIKAPTIISDEKISTSTDTAPKKTVFNPEAAAYIPPHLRKKSLSPKDHQQPNRQFKSSTGRNRRQQHRKNKSAPTSSGPSKTRNVFAPPTNAAAGWGSFYATIKQSDNALVQSNMHQLAHDDVRITPAMSQITVVRGDRKEKPTTAYGTADVKQAEASDI